MNRTLNQLYMNREFSARTYSDCRTLRLSSLNDIFTYYECYGSFSGIPHSGNKTISELNALVVKYAGNRAEKAYSKSLIPIEGFPGLNNFQKDTINRFIFLKIQQLSLQSQKGVKDYLDHNLELDNLQRKILDKSELELLEIPKIGKASAAELMNFIEETLQFITEVSQTQDAKVQRGFRQEINLKLLYPTVTIPEGILESQSIFRLADFLISEELLFTERNKDVFRKGFKVYTPGKRHFQEENFDFLFISKKIWKEVCLYLLKSLPEKLLVLKNLDDNLESYGIDTSSDLVTDFEEKAERINQKNGTSFTPEFIAVIVATFLKEKYTLIGRAADVLLKGDLQSGNSHKWKRLYLVDKDIASNFDFLAFIDEMEEAGSPDKRKLMAKIFFSHGSSLDKTEESLRERIAQVAIAIEKSELL